MNDFSKADIDWLEPLLAAMADAAPYLADGANDKFQSQVAHQMQPPEPEKKKAKKQDAGPTETQE